ncbi:MAG TPA: hypothetical protein VK610_06175, partial [Rhodothermales bacterium]|nr:hypothetical protein [Rhodothermales bacterium]
MPDHADWIDPAQPVTFVPTPTDACTHLDEIQTVIPGTEGCAECLDAGGAWVHLRLCLTCG